MNAAAKLLDGMRANPRDWTLANLMAVAQRYGLECRHHGGSHHVFSHRAVAAILTVPAHRPIKPVYVRQFVALIDAVRAAEESE